MSLKLAFSGAHFDERLWRLFGVSFWPKKFKSLFPGFLSIVVGI
jgi:hypothetical protein